MIFFRTLVCLMCFVGLTAPPVAAWALTDIQARSVRFSEQFIWFDYLKKPQSVAELGFSDGKDRKRKFADYQGKYVLLNLWATWCPPCVEELPALAKLRAKRKGSDFEVLTVSVDRGYTGARVARYLDRKKIHGVTPYHDTQSDIGAVLDINGLPTTYLIDPEGQVRFKMSGPAAWHTSDALAFIDSVIAELEKKKQAKP